jgi:hypothetical protein
LSIDRKGEKVPVDFFLRPEVLRVPNRGTQQAKAGVVEKIADLIFEFG